MIPFVVILVCVSMTLGYDESDGKSSLRSYLVTDPDRKCFEFVDIPSSEVELYNEKIKKATKLIYVNVNYNGQRYSVIKVLEHSAKYLIKLAKFEEFTGYLHHFLPPGCELLSMTLNAAGNCYVMYPELEGYSVVKRLVWYDFYQSAMSRSEPIGQGSMVCIKRNFFGGSSNNCERKDGQFEHIETPESIPLILSILVIILYYLLKVSIWILRHNIIARLVYSKSNVYKCNDNADIRIAVNDIYLIGIDSVPSTAISVLSDIYVSSNFPSLDLKFKNTYISTKQTPWQKLVALVLLLSPMKYMFEFFIISWVFILLYLVYLVVMLFLFHRFAFFSRYLSPLHCDSKNGILCVFIWLHFCFWATFFIASWIVPTLTVLILVNIRYLPIVMASITCYLTLSTRLVNWYKCYLKNILDIVKSAIDQNVLETVYLSKDDIVIVPNREIYGNRFKTVGPAVFINKKGSLMLTKTFFHQCVKRCESEENNPFDIPAACIWRYVCTNVFLFFIAFNVSYFGTEEQLSKSITSISIGGVVLSLILNNCIPTLPEVKTDEILKCHIKTLVTSTDSSCNSYKESFEVVTLSNHDSETIDTTAGHSRPTETQELPTCTTTSNALNNGTEVVINEQNSTLRAPYLLRQTPRRRRRSLISNDR